MKYYPSFSLIALNTSSETTLLAGETQVLYKFKVTANQGDVLLGKFSFRVSSSTLAATTTNYQIYAYSDAFSSVDSQINSAGTVNGAVCPNRGTVEIRPDTGCGTATSSFKIPSGESRWFKLVGQISSVAANGTTETLTIQMEGDAAFPIAHQGLEEDGEMSRYGINATIGVESAGNNDFIWSPTSTTSAGSADTAYLSRNDWTNGYGIPGLPGTNMDAVTLSHQ